MTRRPGGFHLRLQPLEDRITPVAPGLVAVGSQPTGGLTGKIAFIHAGHGDTADNLNAGAWSFQRGETNEMIEDLGNQDQMTFLADYLFRAGRPSCRCGPLAIRPTRSCSTTMMPA